MSFFLKVLGVGFLVLGCMVTLCVIAFSWMRYGWPSVGGLFLADGGLNAIALTFAFLPGLALVMAGYWFGRRPS
jgi:hypothetical protein